MKDNSFASPMLSRDERTLSSGEVFGSHVVSLDLLAAPVSLSPTRSAKMFDIDGVLTNPLDKKVSEDILGKIRGALFAGDMVSFNTGRSVSWTMENILIPLSRSGISDNLLSQVCAVAEKGCCWIEWKDGAFSYFRDPSYSVPLYLINELRASVDRFSPKVFEIDETKVGMFSIEFTPRPETDINAEYKIFQGMKRELVEVLAKVVGDAGQEGEYRIDATTIAIDVQHIRLGKDLGAARVVDFCEQRGITVEKALCFGDSGSDVDMARELQRHGIQAHYLHVGDEKALIGQDLPPHTHQADAPLFHEATARVLSLAQDLREPPATNNDLLEVMSRYPEVLPPLSPWYDKRFLTAKSIRIDPTEGVIDIVVDGNDSPIVMTIKESDKPGQSVEEINRYYTEGKIEDRTDARGVRTIDGGDLRILFSSGSYIALGEKGEERIVLLQRSADARHAPNMFQGAAGRCDRPVGESTWTETLEEVVCLAEKDGELGFLGLVPDYGERGAGIIFDARIKAIRTLRAELTKEHTPEEAEDLQARLTLLERTTKVHTPVVTPYSGGDHFYQVRTWVGDELVENARSVYLSFDPKTNTAEFRQVFYLDESAASIKYLEDGDGYGRKVRILDREEIGKRWSDVHDPSKEFLRDVFGWGPAAK